MTKKRDLRLEKTQKMVSFSDFLASYNKSIPSAYHKVTAEELKQFEYTHPRLFKIPGEWSLERHRKRLMDWLPGYHVGRSQ